MVIFNSYVKLPEGKMNFPFFSKNWDILKTQKWLFFMQLEAHIDTLLHGMIENGG